MKKLVSISVLMIVLAALAVISPAAGETYGLTLTPIPEWDGSGFLFHDESGGADDALATCLERFLGFVPSNFPSGDYKFSTFWFFQPDSAMSPLVAGNSYQLSWDWEQVKYIVYPDSPTFDYSADHLAIAEEQTASGANYMVAATTNAANTFSIAGIFGEAGGSNVFAFMSAEMPSGITLPDGSAPIYVTGPDSNSFGTLEANAVPLPGSLLLLGSGLLGLGAGGWRRRKALSSR